jgi:alpha-galactosidase
MGYRLYVLFQVLYWQATQLANPQSDLKYDNCGVPSNWTDTYTYCVPDPGSKATNGTCPDNKNPAPAGYDWRTSLTAERYRRMRDALVSVGRTILYSLCDWGQADVNDWGDETGNSWRMSGDITRKFQTPFVPVSSN